MPLSNIPATRLQCTEVTLYWDRRKSKWVTINKEDCTITIKLSDLIEDHMCSTAIVGKFETGTTKFAFPDTVWEMYKLLMSIPKIILRNCQTGNPINFYYVCHHNTGEVVYFEDPKSNIKLYIQAL